MTKLMYFAQLADALGKTSEQIALPPSASNVKALIDWLGRRDGVYQKAMADGKELAVMVNRVPATLETAIGDGDEVAFIPERVK